MGQENNPMMPPKDVSPMGPMSPPPPMAGPQQPIDEHSAAKARFDKVQESSQRLTVVRQELDRLMELGDLVKPEDVIDSASTLVGAGLTPRALAGLLSTMPSNGGQALSQWVAQHDQMARIREQAMAKVKPIAAHQLGVAAFKGLMGQGGQPTAPQPTMPMAPTAGNDLMGGSDAG